MEEYEGMWKNQSSFREETLRERFNSFVDQIGCAYRRAMQGSLPEDVVRAIADGRARLERDVRDLRNQEAVMGEIFYSVRASILREHMDLIKDCYQQADRSEEVSFFDFWD